MNFNLKPNFKVLGPKLGKNVNEFGKVLAGLEAHEVVAKLEAGESLTVQVGGNDFEFTKEEVLVNIESKRSEEHTSELQSRQYLVCRLLLEKKKNNCRKI